MLSPSLSPSPSQSPSLSPSPRIILRNVSKGFTLHAQGGQRIPVIADLSLTVAPGDCIALCGGSGVGKSTVLRMIYGNYRTEGGEIWVRMSADGETPERWIDVASAPPHEILKMRRSVVGYVSQFLRVVPRVSTLDVVAEPLRMNGAPADVARERAAELLTQLEVSERLWSLSPLTFSGGEKQRVNAARSFAHPFPILLLDEPTAALDPSNAQTLRRIIDAARADGVAILGVCHDSEARRALNVSDFDMTPFRSAA